MLVRIAIVLVLIGMLGLHAVRSASVRAGSIPLAIALWPDHPQLQLRMLLAEIGARAGKGQSLTPQMISRVEEVARRAPLAPEPFLIKGALAQLEGKDQHAEALFRAAVWRDPRSEAGRYFLAERYLRTGRLDQALVEMAALARLLPGASGQFAPALAEFVQTPGAVPALKSFFQSSPEFEAPVLAELAKSSRNTNLIFTLWSGRINKGEADWRQLLTAKLIEEGQFDTAYSAWLRSTGQTGGGRTLFNPTFQLLDVPPPFNWTLSTKGGVAEPTGDGGLNVNYYGREDAVLAEQILVLTPGNYHLAMELTGTPSDQPSVRWAITCLPDNKPLTDLPVRATSAARRVGMSFVVPPACKAQRLRLEGEVGEFPRPGEFTIRSLQLAKAGTK